MGNIDSNVVAECLEDVYNWYTTPTDRHRIGNGYDQHFEDRTRSVYNTHTRSGQQRTANGYNPISGAIHNTRTQNERHRVVRGYEEYLEDIHDTRTQSELRGIVHDYKVNIMSSFSGKPQY